MEYLKNLSGSKPGRIVLACIATFVAVSIFSLACGVYVITVNNPAATFAIGMAVGIAWGWIGMPAFLIGMLVDAYSELDSRGLLPKN